MNNNTNTSKYQLTGIIAAMVAFVAAIALMADCAKHEVSVTGKKNKIIHPSEVQE